MDGTTEVRRPARLGNSVENGGFGGCRDAVPQFFPGTFLCKLHFQKMG